MTDIRTVQQYADKILANASSKFGGNPLPSNLLIGEEGKVAVYYAPFDYVNLDARIVIVGITPGLTQARLALQSLATDLVAGLPEEEALRRAKSHASFGGPMRANLIKLMDYLGLHDLLNIQSTADLFSTESHIAHFTSVLRYPVFVNGKNYAGSPHPFRVSLLGHALSHFRSELGSLQNALFVPVGKLPNEILSGLVRSGDIRAENVLLNVPHPSGANQERVNYFLEKKPRDSLSSRTNPVTIDAEKTELLGKLEKLRSLSNRDRTTAYLQSPLSTMAPEHLADVSLESNKGE